jgi:hypothetical protein
LGSVPKRLPVCRANCPIFVHFVLHFIQHTSDSWSLSKASRWCHLSRYLLRAFKPQLLQSLSFLMFHDSPFLEVCDLPSCQQSPTPNHSPLFSSQSTSIRKYRHPKECAYPTTSTIRLKLHPLPRTKFLSLILFRNTINDIILIQTTKITISSFPAFRALCTIRSYGCAI